MNLPQIYCKACYVYQEWRGQSHCTSCGNRLSNWHVAAQLRGKGEHVHEGPPDSMEPRNTA